MGKHVFAHVLSCSTGKRMFAHVGGLRCGFETKGDITPFECAVGQMPRSSQSLSMVCLERDKQPAEPMINMGKRCVAEEKGETRSCHTTGAEAEEGASKADQAQGRDEYFVQIIFIELD